MHEMIFLPDDRNESQTYPYDLPVVGLVGPVVPSIASRIVGHGIWTLQFDDLQRCMSDHLRQTVFAVSFRQM